MLAHDSKASFSSVFCPSKTVGLGGNLELSKDK
nr:MAG TPA: hypothetical protein [Caudoviricetes sp.]DAO03384.1 MAG TPA: hypothetical protein [Caudoviricetes sp.]